jgi:Na+/H+-dicarboxylate symporter
MGDKCFHTLNSSLGHSGVAVPDCEKTEILSGLRGSADNLMIYVSTATSEATITNVMKAFIIVYYSL